MTSTPPTKIEDLVSTSTGHWVLDNQAASVSFTNKSFWGLLTVKGSFGELRGEGDVGGEGNAGPERSVTGSITISAASIDTGNAKRDKHLRSDDFFHAETSPDITFTARSAQPTETGLLVEGTLSIAGVERPLQVPVTVTSAGTDFVVLQADLGIDRTEFGMVKYPLGVIPTTAFITVTARFTRSPGPDL